MQTEGLVSAVRWVEQLVMGPLATAVATIAVAAVGILLLQGRLNWRGGLRTIFGCFLIFGAPVIAAGLLDPATVSKPAPAGSAEVEVAPPAPLPPERYDPYAGAALPANW